MLLTGQITRKVVGVLEPLSLRCIRERQERRCDLSSSARSVLRSQCPQGPADKSVNEIKI